MHYSLLTRFLMQLQSKTKMNQKRMHMIASTMMQKRLIYYHQALHK